ncbi:MAG TPA: prepilin-type N-terminal cleavage/methylation domain-containing protein [Desulfuromonadales bacterium]|nr:prepilin-type N-terminal cleavage/methylation domain-containing protein [Desulfuromonadales bacterium]
MPTSTAGPCNKRRGFTLVELVVVLFLIGLFSALTLPMLTGFGADNLNLTARRITGTVKYLFNEAALSGRVYRLSYNLDQATYAAKEQKADGELVPVGGIGAERHLEGKVRFKDITVAGRGTTGAGTVTTDIHPEGWLPETTIHLKDDKGRQLTLHILPYTGTTEVYEGYREFQ